MPSLFTPLSALRNHAGARILLVEDEFIVARDIQRRLELLGYEVIGSVSTGDEAVQKTLELNPDLVFIDIALRGSMNGIQAAQTILARSDVAVVFATANSDRETLERAKEVSPSGFVLKPFDDKEIKLTIDAALSRSAAERALRESEARFAALFEGSAVGLLLVSNVVLECNQEACVLLGVEKKDIIGCTIPQLSPDRQPDGRPSTAAAAGHLEEALAGPRQTLSWTFRNAEGGLIDAVVNLQRVTLHGRSIVQVSILRCPRPAVPGDLSARLAAIVESSEDAIFMKSLDGTILSWNEGAEQVYGYPAMEAVGKPVAMLLPSGKKDEVSGILRRLKAGERVQHFLTERVRKDGRKLDVSVTISPVRDGAGVIVAASTIARDVTEQKKASEVTQQALREKEFLLRELNHRTKNNLQIISSLLNMQAQAGGNREFRELVRQSQDRLRAMSLIHARLCESGDAKMVEFGEYVRGLVSDLAHTYGTARVRLCADAEKADLAVETAMSCGLIINELVTNAFKHAFPGERSGEISVKFRALPEGRFELSVIDNGIGMPEKPGSGRPASLGMGLVSTLVDQIGGSMTVERREGTTVRIAFPR